MATRIIPPKTKQSTTIFKNVTMKDLLFLLVFIIFAILVMNLDINILFRLVIAVFIVLIGCALISTVGEFKIYIFLWNCIKYSLRNKKIESFDFMETTRIKFESDFIVQGTSKSIIIEISGIDFNILPETKQDSKIIQFSKILQNVKKGKIIKLDKPINYSKRIEETQYKLDFFKSSNETKYQKQIEILENELEILNYNQTNELHKAEAFYLIIFGTHIDDLNDLSDTVQNNLDNIGLENKRLDREELQEFYGAFYDKNINENDSFFMDEIKEKVSKLEIDGEPYRIASISEMPLFCANGWLSQLFSIPGTKAVMNFNIQENKAKTLKAIDKTIVELQSRYTAKEASESQRMELENHITALRELVGQIQLDAEYVHNMDFYLIYPETEHKRIKEEVKASNIFIGYLQFRQLTAYMNCSPFIHRTVVIDEVTKDIQSSSLAASFPFITKMFMDTNGNYIGYNNYPVFFNLFSAWQRTGSSKRKSSNMAVLGTTGAGKSYFIKMMLMQQNLKNNKIFILDPENEYRPLCSQLSGNWIDVGGINAGIINPLQVFPSLAAAEEDEDIELGYVSSHRQFLQEFFKVVIPDLDSEASILLRLTIQKLYDIKGITDYNSLKIEKMDPEEFPTMQDLFELVKIELQTAMKQGHDNSYEISNYRKLHNSLLDFAKGGLHSKLWNGYTSFKLDNDFTVLNFQSLFANNNNLVANGQMLLIMRYLMQEVIKNKNQNEKTGIDKNIIIAVDEAHQYIDPNFPIALKFMKDMAKRIRKYAGSLIVLTQNIKDFIGHNEATRTLATAVINGCQYQAIFGLSADDLNSVKDLYKGYAGGITMNELNFIANAEVGQMLMIVDSETRFVCQVALYDGEGKYIENI